MNRALKFKMMEPIREVHLELVVDSTKSTGVSSASSSGDRLRPSESKGSSALDDALDDEMRDGSSGTAFGSSTPEVLPQSVPKSLQETLPEALPSVEKSERMRRAHRRTREKAARGSQLQKGWGRDYEPRLYLVPPLPPPETPPTVEAAPTINPTHIWFMWNGHSWCAFEVLGVPQASSVAVSQEAFRRALAKCDPESHPFLNEAIQAIERCCK